MINILNVLEFHGSKDTIKNNKYPYYDENFYESVPREIVVRVETTGIHVFYVASLYASWYIILFSDSRNLFFNHITPVA